VEITTLSPFVMETQDEVEIIQERKA
jgi:hypothetical protein